MKKFGICALVLGCLIGPLASSSMAEVPLALKPTVFGGGVVTNNGLTARYAGAGAFSAITANKGVRRGKVYFEVTLDSQPGPSADTFTNFGISSSKREADLIRGVNCSDDSGELTCAYAANNFNHTYPINDGETVSVAVDLKRSRVFFGINGNWLNGDPGTGSRGKPIRSGLKYYADVTSSAPSGDLSESETDTWTINFGQTGFKYAVPAGFVSYMRAAK